MSRYTKGGWKVFIDDTGDKTTGYPISITTEYEGPYGDRSTIVRPGGFYPYSWDDNIPQREHVVNAHLMAAAPDMFEALRAFLEDAPDAKDMAKFAVLKAMGTIGRMD